jgi:type IV pilus assembly protein PilF
MRFYKTSCFFTLVIAVLLSACASSKFQGDDSDARFGLERQETPEVQRRASIRLQLAIAYFEAGQYRVALDEIKTILAISPNFAGAYSLRALIEVELNDLKRAEDNFLYAIKLAPNNSDIANNYAWFLCQNGREKQSIPYFEKVLSDRLYETPVKAMSNAGVCSLRIKDVASAERYFLMANREQPNNHVINAALAKIFHDKGMYEKAKIYISKVIKEDVFAADVLWLAIKIEYKLGNQNNMNGFSTQLRRRHPDSKEYALFQKGAFNE